MTVDILEFHLLHGDILFMTVICVDEIIMKKQFLIITVPIWMYNRNK